MNRKIPFILALIILLISAFLLAWGYVPDKHEMRIRNISATQTQLNEPRRLTLEFPPKMRAGVEGDIVRLTLEADDLRNITPTARIEGDLDAGGTIRIPDIYETHQITAEARLDLAGMQVQPSGAIYEPMSRGQSATFLWRIRPQRTGRYRGTVWLHLTFKDRSTGEQTRIAVSAQTVEIEALDLLGLPVRLARTSGVIGSVIAGALWVFARSNAGAGRSLRR